MQVAPEEVADAAGGMEEDKRTAIAEMSAETEAQLEVEAELAERYSVPVEIFQADAGVDTDCVRVSSMRGFNGAQLFAVATSAVAVNVSLLPYLSLEDASSIAQKMKKPECSRLVLRNQKLLTCKVAAAEAMEVEQKKEPVDGEHSLRVAKFRLHLENRLLITHALRGNTMVALSFVKKLYPRVYNTLMERTAELRQQAVMEMVTDLQDEYPYSTSQENDINELNQDLICIIATQCWKDQLKVAGGVELEGVQYKALMENPSLVGAANSKMTADAFRRQLSSLMSTFISNGSLGEDFCNLQLYRDSIASRILTKSFCEKGEEYIVQLSQLLDQSQVDYDEVSNISQLFDQSATLVSATRVMCLSNQFRQVCEKRALVECCILPPRRRLRRLLVDIRKKFQDVRKKFQMISELLQLIGHYDSKAR